MEKEQEREGKVVLVGTYKGSYEKLRRIHQKKNSVTLTKLISRLLKKINNG